jgi:hypothetical protein
VVYVSSDQFDREADRIRLSFRYNKRANAVCLLNEVDRFALGVTQIFARRMTNAKLTGKTAVLSHALLENSDSFQDF